MGKLDGKVALITGGANGIGKGCVETFVAQGARVLIADISDELGQQLSHDLGNSVDFLHTDVAVGADIKAAVDHAVAHFGRLDIMFNNAGFGGIRGGIEEIDEDGYDHAMAVLLKAVVLGMKFATPMMKAQGAGCILSTASVAGLTTVHDTPHVYNTAKAAVIHLTKSVAAELGAFGIRVNCLCPGWTATQIFAGAMDIPSQARAQVPDVIAPVLSNQQPIPRSGVVQDIANAAAWLASEEASFVTGHAMVVDGGLLSGPGASVRGKQREAFVQALSSITE